MSNKANVPLIVDNKSNKNENETETTSEIMLTTRSNPPGNYDSIKEESYDSKILLPGDELMTRAEVPSYPIYIYVLFYIFMIGGPIPLSYLSYQYVDEPEPYLTEKFSAFIITLLFGWFIGAIFKNLLGMPSNYTRKIGHIWGFTAQYLFILAGEDGMGTSEFDLTTAYENIILDTLWAAWTTETFIFLMIKPSRMVSDWMCGDTQSKRWTKWCNCCTHTMDAFERSEDRPNHLLWLNAQFLLYYIFLFLLSFWWNDLDTGVYVLIPVIISGLGDGLAEPVGVKWGKNCCCLNWDNTYKTHGCCTKHDYTRSVAGSSMVWLSGYVAVGLTFEDFTLWQFIIAMIVIPPLGTIVEAKAPHTMDNPFIAAIVGVVATLIIYIPLDDEGLSDL